MPIPFQRFVLPNGLRLIIHEDHTTPLASCNIVYNVGSRDENPAHTGLAHLLEHYMFCGSKNIAEYDTPLQKIGAVNNAYTSQDHTHYYITLPANNLETALWLESDRMLDLAFAQKELDIQKQVVIEEFKEVFLNNPFGDLRGIFNDFVYEKYPYKWTPIGKEISHIETVTMELVRDFYNRFYNPNNAVLVISGNVELDKTVKMVEKWFRDIPAGTRVSKDFPQEPQQTAAKTLEVKRKAPFDLLIKGWKMPQRKDPDFCAYDLLSDLFGTGESSYLYRKFVTELHLFTEISMSVSATAGPGMLLLSANPAQNVDIHEANMKLNQFLYQDFKFNESLIRDLQKVKNNNESGLLDNEIQIESRSSILAVSETISRIEDFENDIEDYRAVTTEQIQRITQTVFQEKKDNTLFYLAEDN